MIPEAHKGSLLYAEHMTRYIAAEEIVREKVVLDIASGSGYGTSMLAANAKSVYGVDNSESAIEYAKERYPGKNISYLLGDAEELPLSNESVDVVVSFETIEHVKNYQKFVKEIKRVLKPDGILLLSTPNDTEFVETNEFHEHQFELNELQTLLEKEFKYLNPYFQSTWASVVLADEKFISTDDAQEEMVLHNFAALPQNKFLYFFFACSNEPLKSELKAVGGLGGHFSARSIEQAENSHTEELEEYKRKLREEEEKHTKTKIKLKAKEREIHTITQSSSYKLAKGMAKSKHYAILGMSHAKAANPKRVQMIARNKRHVKRVYDSEKFSASLAGQATADLAVILHLYYPDMLGYFIDKLKVLALMDYDLYVTIPEGKESAATEVRQKLPQARVAIVPNCGRDVLPFTQVFKHIENKGYDKILKLHTKKSPHRADGQQWRDKIIDSLLPKSTSTTEQIISVLNMKETALVGPEGEYVSLLVNFSATAHYIKNIVSRVINKDAANNLVSDADEYGFFAGTMFWARVDALRPVLDNLKVQDFEPELGQEDSTLAHALERLLNVIPELQGKKIYEISADQGVVPRDPHTTNIPTWSEVALEDS